MPLKTQTHRTLTRRLAHFENKIQVFLVHTEDNGSKACKNNYLFSIAGGLDGFQRMFGRDDLHISNSGKSQLSSASRTSVSGRTVMRALGLKVSFI